jgi:hypothetical protein
MSHATTEKSSSHQSTSGMDGDPRPDGLLVKPAFSLLFRGLSGFIAESPLPNIPTGFLSMAARGCGMIIGYARVSTTEQNLDLQRDALTRARREKII